MNRTKQTGQTEFAGGPPIQDRPAPVEAGMFPRDTRDARRRPRVGRHTVHRHECASLTVMDD